MNIKQIIKELERQGVTMRIEGNVFYLNGSTVSNPAPVIRSYLRDMEIEKPDKVAKEIIQYLR